MNSGGGIGHVDGAAWLPGVAGLAVEGWTADSSTADSSTARMAASARGGSDNFSWSEPPRGVRGAMLPALDQLPEPIDTVEVLRRPRAHPAVARDAVAVGVRALWLQLGIHSLETHAIAEAAGLTYVRTAASRSATPACWLGRQQAGGQLTNMSLRSRNNAYGNDFCNVKTTKV